MLRDHRECMRVLRQRAVWRRRRRAEQVQVAGCTQGASCTRGARTGGSNPVATRACRASSEPSSSSDAILYHRMMDLIVLIFGPGFWVHKVWVQKRCSDPTGTRVPSRKQFTRFDPSSIEIKRCLSPSVCCVSEKLNFL